MDDTSSMYLYVKLNWDVNRFILTKNKDYMNSTSYEYRDMSAHLCPWECRLSVGKPFLRRPCQHIHVNLAHNQLTVSKHTLSASRICRKNFFSAFCNLAVHSAPARAGTSGTCSGHCSGLFRRYSGCMEVLELRYEWTLVVKRKSP